MAATDPIPYDDRVTECCGAPFIPEIDRCSQCQENAVEAPPPDGFNDEGKQPMALVFVSRDYGAREIPEDATLLEATDEDDTDVYLWLDGESVMLQQGYDLIVLSAEALEGLQRSVKVVTDAGQ